MELRDSIVITASREKVWRALNDSEILKRCIPGCDVLERISSTNMIAKIKLKIGPIKAKFDSDVWLSDINAPQSYTLSGEGKGGVAGFAKGIAKVSLEEISESETILRYDAKASVEGKIAQLGSRLLDSTAKKLAQKFFIEFNEIVSDSDTGDTKDVRANISVFQEGSTAIVTINRPDNRNSITYEMWNEFAHIFKTISSNNSVRSVILTGAGNNFSVGADISEFGRVREEKDKAKLYEVAVDEGCSAIMHCTKPVIAVNQGYTLGGGAHLAMSADFRYAHNDAKFGIPAANLSIVYGVKATRKLMALVGLTEAKRILYSAQHFNAEHAKRIGFVDHISDSPMNAAWEFTKILTSKAPLTQVGAKYILNSLASQELDFEVADALIDRAISSKDYVEGRNAFAQKRSPIFRGE